MQQEQIRTEVRDFITTNFIFTNKKTLSDDESLVGSGIVDSTGILELITFLEGRFQITFADNELIADNFDSVTRIVSFISDRLSHTRS